MRDYRTAAIVSREKAVLVTGASDVAAALEVLREPACIYRYGTFYFESSDSAQVDFPHCRNRKARLRTRCAPRWRGQSSRSIALASTAPMQGSWKE